MQHFSCWKDNRGISKVAAIPGSVEYQVYWLSSELLRIFVLLATVHIPSGSYKQSIGALRNLKN